MIETLLGVATLGILVYMAEKLAIINHVSHEILAEMRHDRL